MCILLPRISNGETIHLLSIIKWNFGKTEKKKNKADINDKATVTHLISVFLGRSKISARRNPVIRSTSSIGKDFPEEAYLSLFSPIPPLPRLSCDAVCPVTKESRDHVEHDNF